MICVLTLFGETDLQPVLKKVFGQNDIFFLEDNCVTSVQLTEYVEAHKKEVDAVIIYANAMNTEVLPGYIKELRSFEEHLRVILVLSGGPGQFLRSQINEYKQQKLDLIFDDDGFDVDSLVDVVKKGKLTHKDFKTKRKESGFNGDIDECKPEKKNEKPKRPKSVVAEYAVDSFTQPQGHYTVGIMNAARGAGATWTTNNLARYFAMQNYSTAIVDLFGTEAALMMKLKNIDCYADDIDIDEIKKKYNITVIDFGTPIEVKPDGKNFKLNNTYGPQTVGEFTRCDIKLVLGFTDDWNIEKLNFFFLNDTWHNQFDNSYLFIVPSDCDKVKKLYPDGNIYNRNDDYRENILEVFRKDEK